MTVKQIQCLLVYLGYDTGPVDGLDGPKTREAISAFQRDFTGLDVDGVAGEATQKALRHAVAYGMDKPSSGSTSGTPPEPQTGTFWDDIKHFDREEFRCKCCGKYCGGFPAEPEENLVRTVDAIRERLGIPITINSGVRCTLHNKKVGGVLNSEHLYGRAADLHSSATPQRMKEAAEAVMGKTGGIGIYQWGIHVDTGKYSRWNG